MAGTKPLNEEGIAPHITKLEKKEVQLEMEDKMVEKKKSLQI